jgi:hypothetical protein
MVTTPTTDTRSAMSEPRSSLLTASGSNGSISTTIPPYTTSLQVGSEIGTITTVTLYPLPTTTDSIGYSNVNVTLRQAAGQSFVPIPRVDILPMPVTVTGLEGKSTRAHSQPSAVPRSHPRTAGRREIHRLGHKEVPMGYQHQIIPQVHCPGRWKRSAGL